MSFITTSSETSGVNFTGDSDKQRIIVARDTTLASDFNDTIYSDYSNLEIYNYGSLFGGKACIHLDDKNSSGGRIVNAASGTLGGHIGIEVSGQFEYVSNDGSIDTSSDGIYTDGFASTIINSCYIYSDYSGVEISGSGCILTNSGTIASGAHGILIDVSGTSSYFTNTGTIRGDMDSINDASNGPTSLTNRGTLDGAVLLGSGSDKIRNSGHIYGGVTLGDGTNSFDGRGGTVEGTISGGAGVDTVYLGSDGETVRGGDGADQLYAGTGADTFVLTHLSSSDVDTVHGFDLAHDTFDLEHASFTALKAGQTPELAIGTKATSATDHLFYNTANGGLYYDADGSGTNSAAMLIARLDKGLQLTASNFAVV